MTNGPQPGSALKSKLFFNELFNKWPIYATLSALYVSALILFVEPIYPTNDNFGILLAAKDGFLVEFVGVAFSVYLHVLYKYVSLNVPWYALTLYTAHVVGIALFLFTVSKIPASKIVKTLYAFVYLLCYSLFVYCVDYNSASIMIGANALLAFLVSAKGNNSRLKALLLGIAFSLSFLFRVYGMFGVLAFTAPFIVLYLYQYKIKGRLLLTFLLPFLLFVGVDFLFKGPLASPGYKQYRPYVELQGKLLGYNKERYVDPVILASNQWTFNDFMLFLEFMYVDEHKYSREKLQNLLDYVDRAEKMDTRRSAFDLNQLRQFISTYAPFLMLLGGLFFLALYGSNWRTVIMASAFILYGVCVALFLEIYYRFPIRIGVPLLLMYSTFLFSSILLYRAYGSAGKNFLKKISLILFIFLILSGGYLQTIVGSRYYSDLRRLGARIERIYATLNSKYNGSVILLSPTRYYFKGIAGNALNNNFDKFRTVDLGWLIFSPRFYAQLNEIGTKAGYELFPAFVDKPNYYVLAGENGEQLILNYLRENGYPAVEAMPVELFNGFLVLYKLVSK